MRKVLFIVIGLICSMVLILSACNNSVNTDYIVKINSREISKQEFMVYLYEATKNFKSVGGADILETDFDGKSAEELVKERAMEALTNVIVTTDKASEYNVVLSDEEKKLAVAQGDEQLLGMTNEEKEIINISKEEMYSIMEDTLLYNKVFDVVTEDYKMSDIDFQAFFDENIDKYSDAYTSYTVSSILVKDEKTAIEVVNRARAGENFKLLFDAYEADDAEKSNGGVIETYKGYLEDAFGVPFNLEISEISEPLKQEEGYYVLKVDKKSVLNDKELIELAKTEYIDVNKQQLFDSEFSRWSQTMTIEKNDEVWNTLQMLS